MTIKKPHNDTHNDNINNNFQCKKRAPKKRKNLSICRIKIIIFQTKLNEF